MRERLTLTTKDQQRIEVVGRWVAGLLVTEEAVALLGCSERTAWRLRAAFLTHGADGLVHGNRGRASPRRLADADRARIVELARGRYRGVNDTHLAELLAEAEGIGIGRSSLQRLLRGAGVASPRRRRPPRYRSRRERMAQAGLLVQLDGSRHDWLEGRGPTLTLVGGIDDATGRVVGATFRDDEDGAGYLLVLRQMAHRHGLPAAVYRDRAGIFAPTRPGEWAAEATQVGRAFAELGITSIAARSPQAKGRIERLWGTFQDRLVSELRLARATDRVAANEVLERFVPAFNRRFGVAAAVAAEAWRPVPANLDLGRVCAFRWRRAVGNDNTVRVEGALLQLPPGPGGRGLSRRRVEVELRVDGQLLVRLDGRILLAVAAPPEPRRLHTVRILAPSGPPPAPGGDARPGYRPRVDHPWNRPGPKAPTRTRALLTESLSGSGRSSSGTGPLRPAASRRPPTGRPRS
jgi:transposase